MRRSLIAGNWKMYTEPVSARRLAAELKSKLMNCSWADLAVFPPYTSIPEVVSTLHDTEIEIGGQDLHWEKEGAFTGEISASMLFGAGCRAVLIGHSERRTYFGETDDKIRLKTIAALSGGLRPIVCIGETLAQREEGITNKIIEDQILNGLNGIEDISKLVIAYEPVWAIGTGRNASPEQADDVHRFIRYLVGEKWGKSTKEDIRILYGGSVKPDNANALSKMEDIDGFLVGGASLKADSFTSIAESFK